MIIVYRNIAGYWIQKLACATLINEAMLITGVVKQLGLSTRHGTYLTSDTALFITRMYTGWGDQNFLLFTILEIPIIFAQHSVNITWSRVPPASWVGTLIWGESRQLSRRS